MKKLIVPAAAVLIVNLLAGLLITAYAPMNLLFTSLAIVINTFLVWQLFAFGAESTHRLSLGICFLAVGTLEFLSGFFAPARWTDNWWAIGLVTLTAIEAVLAYLAIHYSRKS